MTMRSWSALAVLVAVGLASPVAAGEAAPPAVDAPTPAALLRLGSRDAALLALERNRDLRVRRLGVTVAQADVGAARAAFDPTVSAEVSRSTNDVGPGGDLRTDSARAGVAITTPTGTTLGVDGSATGSDESSAPATAHARVGVSVTQALLRGARPSANLADLRVARLDVAISRWELAGFAIELASRAEDAYWDLLLARLRLGIVRESLALAERQRDEVSERIKVGRMAEIELAVADAEVAARRQSLIDAEAGDVTARLRLLALLQPDAEALLHPVETAEEPTAPTDDADAVADHVALARRRRPDVEQARLLIDRGELVVVRTRDGLLPRLDLFAAFGRSGYARSIGGAVGDIDGSANDGTIGLRLDYALGNRAARSAENRAVASRAQAEESLANLLLIDEADVRIAHVEVARSREQIGASAASVRAQEEALRAETEKLRVGSGTALSVAQAQRDLTQRRLDQAEAVIARRKALTALFRADGSLLDRRGIRVPE